jgi:branched-chain amino acid transport system substrate-binding protein
MSNHQIWSAEMAIKEINSKGGVLGKQLKLYVEDTQQSSAVAATKAEKLILSDKIDFLLGPILSGEALNVMQVCK